MKILKEVNPASSCFAGKPMDSAISELHFKKPQDVCIDEWDLSQIQLCPQHPGCLSDLTVERLLLKYPNTQFRLHANVRVFHEHRPFDAGFSLSDNIDYIKQLKHIQNKIKAKVYTYHAPMHKTLSWDDIIQNINELQDYLQIPVGIEGLYSNHKTTDDFWLNSYETYTKLFESNIPYALDLSHLNIVYQQADQKTQDKIIQLTKEMINHKNCIEVHVSANDGKHDSHKSIKVNEWWLEILNFSSLTANCSVFCESLQRS
jgi:hypothetical protein